MKKDKSFKRVIFVIYNVDIDSYRVEPTMPGWDDREISDIDHDWAMSEAKEIAADYEIETGHDIEIMTVGF